MQRLHEDDLVDHVLAQEQWEVVRFPAIAQEDELHQIETILGPRTFMRRRGEALHPGLAWRVVLRTRGAKSREIKAVAVLRLEPSRGQQPTGPAGLTDVSLTGDR